MVILYGCRTNF